MLGAIPHNIVLPESEREITFQETTVGSRRDHPD